MKKSMVLSLLLAAAMIMSAAPVRRGWTTVQLADGTPVDVQTVGDEWFRFTVTRDGKEVRRNAQGRYEIIGDAPTSKQLQQRRAAAPRRAQKGDEVFGLTPYLPPKGVVIMVNFQDTHFQETTTSAIVDNLCNSENCTVNRYNNTDFGSIAQYFRDQSDGQYNLQLDIYGPVTLSHNFSYYGANNGAADGKAADAVIEACKLLDNEIDFTQYDWNNDGQVDFVYLFYAGRGENYQGADPNLIWPHSWDMQEAWRLGYCSYGQASRYVDGLEIFNYAVSNELDNQNSMEGIGVICHEYGHIIGLPDHYDINANSGASVNFNEFLTPNEWDTMDQGCYNGGSHCPASYNVWEKAFCGWYTPQNLGAEAQRLELVANGKDGYNAYQINASGTQQTVTSGGWCYYIENRQAVGWDAYLPGHGMLMWKVNYDQNRWFNNEVNTTDRNPLFTMVSAYGTEICSGGNYMNNAFPGGKNVTSWDGLEGKPLFDITEQNGIISLVYIDYPPYTVKWIVDGEVLEEQSYKGDGSEDLVPPAKEVIPCEGTTFIGWTMHSSWVNLFETPDDLFTVPTGKVTENGAYTALFE